MPIVCGNFTQVFTCTSAAVAHSWSCDMWTLYIHLKVTCSHEVAKTFQRLWFTSQRIVVGNRFIVCGIFYSFIYKQKCCSLYELGNLYGLAIFQSLRNICRPQKACACERNWEDAHIRVLYVNREICVMSANGLSAKR